MKDQTINVVFNASMNVSQVKTAVHEIQNTFSKVALPKKIDSEFSKTLDRITNEISNFERLASKESKTFLDFSGLDKSGKQIIALYDKLHSLAIQLGDTNKNQLAKLVPENLTNEIEMANAAMKKYVDTINTSTNDIQNQNKAVKNLQGQLTELRSKLKTIKDTPITKKKDFEGLKKGLEEANQECVTYEANIKKLADDMEKLVEERGLHKPRASKDYRSLATQKTLYEGKLEEARKKIGDFQNLINNAFTKEVKTTQINEITQSISDLETKLTEAKNVLETLKTTESNKALAELQASLEKIGRINLKEGQNSLQEMKDAIAQLKSNNVEQVRQGLETLTQIVKNGVPALESYKESMRGVNSQTEELNRQSRDVDALKSRIQYFFGITNAINLFRRAITSALNTVKELDKAMTETAVVTDFSVSDMWNKLPEYTEVANKLGTTTLGAYETMTLFYQQGLKTNEVFEIGTETMKMARIAGMDYAEATNMMTAALRGFNMELNEGSAQRVNDVYSKLAAVTASDTQEISTAMTKTASIANSANMEFETTAAFLSQIIETTRESAETAGTAMKTVIARFQELKKDPSLIEDVDGEAVDANKIESALKTIGVALRDTSGQFRNLDEVFLEIAERWDNLSTNQQRYIATMAAGSRLDVNRLQLVA